MDGWPGNMISGNAKSTACNDQRFATDNLVAGDLIGTDPDLAPMPLGNHVAPACPIASVPTTTPSAGPRPLPGNVISGNQTDGVNIHRLRPTTWSPATRSAPTPLGPRPGNSEAGVLISTGSGYKTLGGTTSGSGNIISGNQTDGVYISGVPDNVVADNLIGMHARAPSPSRTSTTAC